MCPYARVFEPRSARGEGPSGLADWPRPFVFRASHLDGTTVRMGERFHLDVHMFEVRQPASEYFKQAFAQLAREGLGPARVQADLEGMEQLDLNGAAVRGCCGVELGKAAEAERVRVRFVTPTELKSEQQVAERPDFGALFGRLRDRISILRELYGEGALDIDFRAMKERAEAVRMVRWEGREVEVDRYSTRSGQRHPLGGFVGEAEYEGDLGEFLGYLELGKWVGVGRHTVWGKGEMETHFIKP